MTSPAAVNTSTASAANLESLNLGLISAYWTAHLGRPISKQTTATMLVLAGLASGELKPEAVLSTCTLLALRATSPAALPSEQEIQSQPIVIGIDLAKPESEATAITIIEKGQTATESVVSAPLCAKMALDCQNAQSLTADPLRACKGQDQEPNIDQKAEHQKAMEQQNPISAAEITNPRSASGVREAKPAAMTTKRKAPAGLIVWTPEEDAIIRKVVAENPHLNQNAQCRVIAELLKGRTIMAIRTRMRDKLGLRSPMGAEKPKAGEAVAPKTATPARPAFDKTSALGLHLARMPYENGWTAKDDLELLTRVLAGEKNSAALGAAFDVEPHFIVTRIDRLTGRQSGGQVKFSREAVRAALASVLGQVA